MNKKILIFILVLSILFICFGGYKIYNYLKIKNAKIEVILVDNLNLEFNDKKRVSDYIKSINGKIKDDYIIDSSKVGLKNIKFEFINDDNIELDYSFNINVVDTVAPVVWLGDSYSLEKGSNVDLVKSILCGDNYDNKPTCYIEGDYNLNEVGEYKLTFNAIDQSKNITSKDFTLYIYEKSDDINISNPEYTQFSEFVKKYKNENTEIGIDVSTWQGDIDFKKLKDEGVEFIIIRVGYSGDNENDHKLDSKFERNIKEANKYKIKAGVYFYSYATTEKEAKDEAKWVAKKIKPYKIDLPVVYDWEEWGSFNELNLSFFGLTNMAETFLDIINSKGYDAMLYSSKNYLEKIWFETKYDVWLAHYTDNTNYKGKYKYWQVSSSGIVNGINGSVDINVRYINK